MYEVTAKDGFVFMATMNPGGDYGKKEVCMHAVPHHGAMNTDTMCVAVTSYSSENTALWSIVQNVHEPALE